MSGPNPRAAAVSALVKQEQDGFSNLVLDAELKRQQLEGRDKAFASAIFYTVLEHRGTLDYMLGQFLPKGLARLDAPVREILRSALAQARYMQVPASAAVNEAVKLTRAFRKSSAAGLVNAVLRRACTYDLSTARFRNETERLMVLGSAGKDVADFLRIHYPDEALGILTYAADGGRTSLRVNPLKADAATLCEKLAALGAAAEPGLVPGSVLAAFEGSPAENAWFRQGYYHVEGQASQLAALYVEAKPGETVLDLCAAPGGKTLLLAEEMQGTGRLVSCDAAENRVRLIRTAVERMGFANVETLCNDATRQNPSLPQADRILVDAPCSGLGILAKKPDIRYKTLDLWARYQDFQLRVRNAIIKRQSLDFIMAGFNGVKRAETSDRSSNPMLQDVAVGWLQKYRNEAPARVMSKVTDEEGHTTSEVIRVGKGGDYASLDALVMDATNNLIEPWYQEDPDLVVIVGRQLLADKYFPIVNKEQDNSEMLAADVIISQKRIGNLPAVRVPYFPADAMLITKLENLSIYYMDDSHRRVIVENPKLDRVENYESMNIDYVVEDYAAGCLVEKIKVGDFSTPARATAEPGA